MNDGNTDREVEAPAIIQEKKGQVIESDLANLHGQVEIDDDNIPVPENRSSVEEGRCTNKTFDTAEGHNTNDRLFNFGGYLGVPTLLQAFLFNVPLRINQKSSIERDKQASRNASALSWIYIMVMFQVLIGNIIFEDCGDF